MQIRAVGAWGVGALSPPVYIQTGAAQPAKVLTIGGADGTFSFLNSCEALNLDAQNGLGAWRQLPPLDMKRGFASVALLLDRVIVTGGFNAQGPRGAGAVVLSTTEALDLENHRWVRLPDMISPRRWHSTVTICDKLYATGGFNGVARLAHCEVFDPRRVMWYSIAPMHVARDGHVALAAPDGKLYVIGGYDGQRRLRDCEVYDPARDVWRQISPMQSARDGHGAVFIQGKIFVCGGYDGTVYHKSTEIYDPQSDTWTFGPAMSAPRYQHTCVVIEGPTERTDRIVIAGGNNGHAYLKSTEVFSYQAPEVNDIAIDSASLSSSSSSSSAFTESKTISTAFNNLSLSSSASSGAFANWSWRAGPSMLAARAGAGAVCLPRRADLPPDVLDYATMRKLKAQEQRKMQREAEEGEY